MAPDDGRRTAQVEQSLGHRFGSRFVVRNSIWFGGDFVMRLGHQLVTLVLFAKYLGPNDFGILAYGYVLLTLSVAVGNFGLERIVIRVFLASKYERGDLAGSSLALRAVTQTISTFAFACVALLTGGPNNFETLVYVLVVCSGLFYTGEVIEYFFRAQMMSYVPAIARAIAITVSLAVRVVAVHQGASLPFLAITYALEPLIVSGILLSVCSSLGGLGPRLRVRRSIAIELARQSAPIMFGGVTYLLYRRVDQIAIRWLMGPYLLGIYAVAGRLYDLLPTLVGVLGSSIFPRLVHDHGADEPRYQRHCIMVSSAVTWGAIFALILYAAIGESLIFILFGPAFEQSADILLVLMMGFIASCNASLRGTHLVIVGRQNVILYINLITLFSAIGLIALLAPSYGLIGVAAAMAGAQAIAAWGTPMIFRASRQFLWLQILALNPVPGVRLMAHLWHVLALRGRLGERVGH